jgi:hypothetical protein
MRPLANKLLGRSDGREGGVVRIWHCGRTSAQRCAAQRTSGYAAHGFGVGPSEALWSGAKTREQDVASLEAQLGMKTRSY